MEIMMKKILPLIMMLSLSGCWSGEGFYTPSESVAAIPAGKYKLHAERGLTAHNDDDFAYGEKVEISYGADGRALVENTGEGDANNSTLVKLGDAPGLYVVQADLGARVPAIGSSLYALLQVTDRGYNIAVPRCDEKRLGKSRAVASGILVGKPVCRYSNRADLEEALLRYSEDPIRWTEYRAVKKRHN
jgi:hypothetical protein